jgi:hypothetical protein
MNKKQSKILAIVLVTGILVLASIVFLNSINAYKFELEKDSVLFSSNEAQPVQLMQEFNLNDTVFVSPSISERGNENSFMSTSFNMVQIVLIGNDKNAVSLWRVMDSNKALSSCRTNSGNAQTDAELSALDCEKILDDKSNAIILISLPSTDAKSRIILSDNRIEIVPSALDKAPNVSFAFLSAMYANAADIIRATNNFTQFIK